MLLDYADKTWLQPVKPVSPVKPVHGLMLATVAGLLLLGIPVPIFPIYSEA